MQDIKTLLTAVSEKLTGLARSNAVVARKISVGDRHVVPLCELAMGFAGGGGQGEATDTGGDMGSGKGTGGGAGGMAKAAPVAVIIVDGGRVRIEGIGR